MAFPPSDPGLLADPATWVLIIHTLFANGSWNTIKIGPYSEKRCNDAAASYDAGAGLTVHFGREGEGGDQEMVLRAIAICIPGPNGPARRP